MDRVGFSDHRNSLQHCPWAEGEPQARLPSSSLAESPQEEEREREASRQLGA